MSRDNLRTVEKTKREKIRRRKEWATIMLRILLHLILVLIFFKIMSFNLQEIPKLIVNDVANTKPNYIVIVGFY